MIALFGFGLGWFPTSGSVDVNLDPGTFTYYINKLQHLVLPGICLALLSTVSTVQYLRNEVIDAKQSDYVKQLVLKVYQLKKFIQDTSSETLFYQSQHSSDLYYWIIQWWYLRRTIFGYPGMGQLFYQSIQDRDYSVVTTLMLFSGFLTLLGSTLSDIIMAIVDPRIKLD